MWQKIFLGSKTCKKVKFCVKNLMKKKHQRNWLERKVDEYNHTMELIRTVLPLIILILQIYIIMKVI